MADSNYSIVFKKLDEAKQSLEKQSSISDIEASCEEMDEIDELRRLVSEISNPKPSSYTTT